MGVPGDLPLHGAGSPASRRADLSSLRRAVVGGAPMPEALLETWQRARRRDRPGLRPDRGGAERPLPAARGRGAQDGLRRQAVPVRRRRAPRSETGELLEGAGRGRAGRPRAERLRRLLAQPGGDRAPRSTDGWLRTGDVAERDDEGYYRIRGRLKDMYISGGENVYPAEVESVLHEHPAVADAAVVGVPDERWGEVGRRVRRARAGRRRRARTSSLEHCAARLARFKVPQRVALRRRAAALRHGQGAEGRAARAIARRRSA